MPKYDYRCKSCEKTLSIRHSSSESPEFDLDCETGKCEMEKVPPFSFRDYTKKQESAAKPGQIVKEHIEVTKREVELQKKELKKDY